MSKNLTPLRKKIEQQLNILYSKEIDDVLERPETIQELSITLWEDEEIEEYLWACKNLKYLNIDCAMEADVAEYKILPTRQAKIRLEKIFTHFPKLEFLTLDSTMVEFDKNQGQIQLPTNINDLTNLKGLNITGDLVLLPDYLNLPNLEKLSIDGQIFVNDELGTFPSLNNLFIKDVINFPEWVYKCDNLQELNIQGQYDISDQLYKLSKLESLTIGNISKNIRLLDKLKHLNLINKSIKLPEELSELKHLSTITFHGSVETKSFEVLAKIVNLQELVFFGASEFNFALLGFKKLTKLIIYDDKKHREELPSTIFNLTNLKSLTYSDGLITSVSNEIDKLHKLTELNLAFNRLIILPIEQIASLPKLKKFSVIFQKIKKAEKKQLKIQLEALSRINCNHPQIY